MIRAEHWPKGWWQFDLLMGLRRCRSCGGLQTTGDSNDPCPVCGGSGCEQTGRNELVFDPAASRRNKEDK